MKTLGQEGFNAATFCILLFFLVWENEIPLGNRCEQIGHL